MKHGYFVTGTDTDVGKTCSTVALMRHWQRRGFRVAGMKPVAAGCRWRDGGWKNADALLLRQYSSVALDYELVNPYAFELPVSPHVACGPVDIALQTVLDSYAAIMEQTDVLIVEGAGGWYSPLDRLISNADLARELGLPVILVVGMRLGCLNHALLTRQAIRLSGLACAGWIAVEVEAGLTAFQDNLAYLRGLLDAPLLGVLPHLARIDFDYLADCLRLPNWRDVDVDQNLNHDT